MVSAMTTIRMKKILATGMGAVAISIAGLALNGGSAEAAALRFRVDGTFLSGGTLTGTFDYETEGNVYSNWSFVSSPDALTGAAIAPFTNPFVYNTSNSTTGLDNSIFSVAGTDNSVVFERSQTPQLRALSFLTEAGLSTLTTIGNSTSLLVDANDPVSASYEYYVNMGDLNEQLLGLSGGTITSIEAVPEPLTILGAATAVGFGAAFKRRALKNNKKA